MFRGGQASHKLALPGLAPNSFGRTLASCALTKSLAFPDSVKEVSIVREGKRLVIAPSNVGISIEIY